MGFAARLRSGLYTSGMDPTNSRSAENGAFAKSLPKLGTKVETVLLPEEIPELRIMHDFNFLFPSWPRTCTLLEQSQQLAGLQRMGHTPSLCQS